MDPFGAPFKQCAHAGAHNVVDCLAAVLAIGLCDAGDIQQGRRDVGNVTKAVGSRAGRDTARLADNQGHPHTAAER